MKLKGTRFNTHYCEVIGSVNKCVDDKHMKTGIAKIGVHFTSEPILETLSIECSNIQFTMNFKEIQKMIDEARSERKRS